VAHSLSAKKRIRQNEKRRAANRARKLEIKDQTKVFTAAMQAGDAAKAETELRKLTSSMDRVAAKHTIHKKAASRKRSRLTLRLNALKAGPKPGAKATTTRPKKKAGAGTKAAKA
jgi:small subunit ribosomal protein S20